MTRAHVETPAALLLGACLVLMSPAAVMGAAVVGAAHPAPVVYRLGLLERGPAWTPERTPHTDSIQAGHMTNIGRMSRMGVLAAAGPFAGNGDVRGIFVWEPGTERIDTLLAADPAIASGRLKCELYNWVAPPGLGKDYKRRLAERGVLLQVQPDSMVSYGFVMLRGGGADGARAMNGKLARRHNAYFEKLRAEGRLLFRGVLDGPDDLGWVLIMKGDSSTVAQAVAADPAVRAGRLTPHVLRWWNAWGTIPGH